MRLVWAAARLSACIPADSRAATDNVALLQPAASLTLYSTKEISHSMVTMVQYQNELDSHLTATIANVKINLLQVTFSCPMSFEAFPFDTQVAIFQILSILQPYLFLLKGSSLTLSATSLTFHP